MDGSPALSPTSAPMTATATSVKQVSSTDSRVASVAAVVFAVMMIGFIGLMAANSLFVLPAIACLLLAITCFAYATESGGSYRRQSPVMVGGVITRRTVMAPRLGIARRGHVSGMHRGPVMRRGPVMGGRRGR